MPSTYENDGVTCASWCPMPPPPDAMVACPPVTNADGCMMPPLWMPSLAECPAGPPAMRKAPCPPPVTCGDDTMACAPPPGAMEAAAEAGACPPPPMCMPSTYENDGVTCASWCPMPPPQKSLLMLSKMVLACHLQCAFPKATNWKKPHATTFAQYPHPRTRCLAQQ